MINYSKNADVNQYLNSLSTEYRNPVLKIRKMIYNLDPEISERLERNKLIFNNGSEVCCFKIIKNSVRLIFLKGSELSDANHLLREFGQKSRSLELLEADQKIFDAVKKMLGEALGLTLKKAAYSG
ncbi:DUF1801 domain-containing protein [Flexithrix dorotheae]|uniref:DUF1801 domain-containing protein n=1 Tax=Flexithrix dorotheae TaxID=70993 RepID=UPI000361D028|nr:DUF1801 domain-containing protein [Flexithrix dorotheae]